MTVIAPPAAPSFAADAVRSARHTLGVVLRQPALVLAWLIVAIAVGWAVAPGLFTSLSPYDGNPDAIFTPPTWEHPFGADRLGRDLFARAVYGAGTTLSATLVAVAIAFIFGTIIGLAAGYFGRFADTAIMRLVDVLLAVPGLLLAMVMVSVLGYSTRNVAIAVGIASIAGFARVMRAEVIEVMAQDYIRAADALGVSRARAVLRHVLPNSLNSVIALAALEVGSAILAVASLGFLGYGAPPPEPEWGLLVAEGRDYLGTYPWIAIMPALSLAAVVISAHRISVSLRKERRS
ncbi:MAG: ABC transporter permease [Bifidobacteriaceae bacterium]|jgi:peptide/nickel transport system permease protein|nr:ABC transporter permease [Bifidobacteriaceae bacterium]